MKMLDLSTLTDIPARTAWAEARGEGASGMHAVLNVIANRAKQPGWWGRDANSVCLSPWQFSCWNENDPNRELAAAVTTKDQQFVTALMLNALRMRGALVDISNGANSYYAAGTPEPAWAKGRYSCAKIGRHLFFRIGLDGHAGMPSA